MTTRTEPLGVSAFLDALASRTSTPGGGSAAAVTGASGAALLTMVSEFTRDKGAGTTAAGIRCTRARTRLIELAAEDMIAFDEVMAWYRRDRQSTEYQHALHNAALVPCSIMAECAALVEDARLLQQSGNSNLITDVAIGAELLAAAITSADLNIMINARAIKTAGIRDTLRRDADSFLLAAGDLKQICQEIRRSL